MTTLSAADELLAAVNQTMVIAGTPMAGELLSDDIGIKAYFTIT
ncbi:MAG: hypothetical protein WAN38_00480 [Terriglobales bacterium]